ncbi:MAG: glucosaminidase domain-containing protein [Gemella sp.]|nr:glucosaminidase domain-containing protein [Gemella sp.]
MKKCTKILYILLLLLLGVVHSTYAAEKYVLEVESEVYNTAEDALKSNNAKILYPKGEYYIYKEKQGMLNISKTPQKSGAWINPNVINLDRSVESIKVEDIEIYSVQNSIKSYTSSNDAQERKISNSEFQPGDYYIHSQENGMLNISSELGKEGMWINPTEQNNNSLTGYSSGKYYIENTLANGWYNDGDGEYFFYLGERYTGYAKDSTGLKYFNKGRYSDNKTSKKNISLTKDENLAINSFQYMNLVSETKYTAEELNRVIDYYGGITSKFYSKGQIFKEAEEKYKINALYLLAHAAIETSWGHSQIANDKNNFFGIAAFDDTPYQSATRFENTDSGILKGAEWISSIYLHSDSYPADGPFLGNKTEGMNKNYATDVRWGRNIARVMKEINNHLGNLEK